jgi:hypothetical protein
MTVRPGNRELMREVGVGSNLQHSGKSLKSAGVKCGSGFQMSDYPDFSSTGERRGFAKLDRACLGCKTLSTSRNDSAVSVLQNLQRFLRVTASPPPSM